MVEFDNKIAKLDDRISQILKEQKFKWKLPKQSELQIKREEYRNLYDYSRDFEIQYNLFGEKTRLLLEMKNKGENQPELTQKGAMVNIKTQGESSSSKQP